MALAVEAIGQLIANISLFSAGMAFGVLALVLAISRTTTTNKDHWALVFASFAWGIALIVPQLAFSALIFGFGAFALSIAFMPLLKKINDKSIAILAVVAGVFNLLLLTGSGAYALSLDWQTNMDSSEGDINSLFGNQTTIFSNSVAENKLCRPNEKNPDGSDCEDDVVSGSFNENLFVPFASILTIGTYLGKFVAFIGMTAVAPFVLSNHLATQGYFQNVIILYMMGFLVTLWEMAIFYKLTRFIFDKRG